MNISQLLKSAVLVLCLICLFPKPAMAYIGPGAGLSTIGLFLAIVVGVIVAIFGFVWYPIKRLLRAMKKQDEPEGQEEGGEAE